MIKQNIFGALGILIALIAVGIAASYHLGVGDSEIQSKSTTEKVLEKGAELLGLETEEQEPEAANYWIYAYLSLGILALALGVVSYIKKENHRIAGMAGALAIVAIGWQFIMIGLAVALIIFLLANFSLA